MRHRPVLGLLASTLLLSVAGCVIAAPPMTHTRPGTVSGSTSGAASGMETGVDRPGNDYRDFDLATADPALCQQVCAREARCVAWVYVKPGVQGPKPRCWLKSTVPAPKPDSCCVSGVK